MLQILKHLNLLLNQDHGSALGVWKMATLPPVATMNPTLAFFTEKIQSFKTNVPDWVCQGAIDASLNLYQFL